MRPDRGAAVIPNSKRIREIDAEWHALIGQPIQLSRTDLAQQDFRAKMSAQAHYDPEYTIADYANDVEAAAVKW